MTGMRQALHALEAGTSEVKRLLVDEVCINGGTIGVPPCQNIGKGIVADLHLFFVWIHVQPVILMRIQIRILALFELW
jgi:hypothetical protein